MTASRCEFNSKPSLYQSISVLVLRYIDQRVKLRVYDGNQRKHEKMDHRVSSGTGW